MSSGSPDFVWWNKGDKAHESLNAMVDKIHSRQASRRAKLAHYLRLYGDREISGYTANGSARSHPKLGLGSSLVTERRRLSLNVVRNMVDSFSSIQSKGRPRASYMTDAGDWSLQMQAKKREKFVAGILHKSRGYQLRDRAIKCAALTGDGFVRVMDYHGEVRLEFVFPGEILVDDADGLYGEPRSLFREKVIDRQVALGLWPGSKRAIMDAPQPEAHSFGRDQVSDQIVVREAWHLPSYPGCKDGRHAIVIQGDTLLSEAYTEEVFPFAHWRFSEEPLGFWGCGLAEQLSGIQFEINQLLKLIQNNMYLGGNIKILMERGSNIVDAQISNALRGVQIEYTGTKPEFHVHDVVTNQVLSHLQYLVGSAYEITGIGKLSSSGEMPGSLAGSGRAQLVYKKIESERFAAFAREDEEAFLDMAKLCVSVARQIDETRKGGYKIRYVGKRWMESLDASEVLGDEPNTFEMRVIPSSQLPHDFAGRMAIVDHLEQRGRIDAATGNELMELPDTDAYQALTNAPMELIDYQIERILEDGEQHTPDARMDLNLALTRGNLAFNLARLRNAPPEHLDMLNTWLDLVQEQLNPPPAEPPLPDPAAMGAMDPAMMGAASALPMDPGAGIPAGPVPPMAPGGAPQGMN